MKIIQISDIHLKLLKNQDEYRFIFDKFYKLALSEKPDLIINTGDTLNNKIHLTPELISLTSEFFINLVKIAPTLIILGNHDLALNSKNRLDGISPIVDLINNSNLKLLKYSQEYKFNDDVTFNILSIVDPENWKIEPSEPNKINIALHHGTVIGSDTDLNWTLTNGTDLSVFKSFDYVMLGDIHKTFQNLDNEKRCCYPGSFISQNFGETNDKGFLVWEIESKEKFSVRHVPISNPNPYITVELEQDGSVPSYLEIPISARIRTISNSNLTKETIRKSLDIIKTKYQPISVINVSKHENKNSINEIIDEFKQEDLRDLGVQEKLIKEYLKDYKPTDDLLERVYDINKKYNSVAQINESIARNVDYKVVKYSWDNLFSFGKNNSINISNLNGIAGIFGKNYSGKTSAIESFLFTVFNGITKKSKKTVNIINLNANDAVGEAILEINSKFYRITRKLEKYLKKLHGVESLEAKTSINFEEIDIVTGNALECLNGVDRNETDRNINKLFGSLDDFLLTSMSSQLGALSFIDKGSTERKEILGKFLDVDFFSEKFNLANDDVAMIKSSLKKYDNKDFDLEISETKKHIKTNQFNTTETQKEKDSFKEKISKLEKEILTLENEISNSKTTIIDFDELQFQLQAKQLSQKTLQKDIDKNNLKISENKIKLAKVEDFITSFDIENIKKQEKEYILTAKELSEITTKIDRNLELLENNQVKVNLLKEVPCGPEHSHCKFIKGAYEAQKTIDIIDLLLKTQRTQENEILKKDSPDKLISLREQITKFEQLLIKKKEYQHDNSTLELETENKKSKLAILQHEIDNLEQQKSDYFKNEEIISSLSAKKNQKQEKSKELFFIKKHFNLQDEKLIELYKFHGSLEQKIENLIKEQTQLANLRKEYEAYELFLKCMHSNGISFDIIKRSLPTINNEIAKNLENIVDFEIFFKNEDNRLELYIKKPNDTESLPIEMSSAAQKMLAAMAIRLAFIHISTLPKSDVFILDEPGTAFDEESMDGFIKILEVVKSHFKCVFLISHLEQLKDCADTVITIDNKSGFASINA